MNKKRTRDGIPSHRTLLGLGFLAFLFLESEKCIAVEVATEDSKPQSLSPAHVGDLLLAELRCAACHDNRAESRVFDKSAPNLADVGARISPAYLKRFLASPSSCQPGSTMPDLLASYTEDKRQEMAEALMHFLVSQSASEFSPNGTESSNPETGKQLFHSIGCVACHSPRELIAEEQVDDDDLEEKEVAKEKSRKETGVNLDHLNAKYSHRSLSEFLFQPLRVRSSGRMPDMKLTVAESQSIASYLIGDASSSLPLRPIDSLVIQGKKYFQELNCAACHAMEGIAPAPVLSSLFNADLSRGCISQSKGIGPRYYLDETKIQSIRESLRGGRNVDSEEVVIAKSMSAWNCAACHIRDGVGGVPKNKNSYFRTSEKNLGDDGRIPPPLTLAGAKFQPVWLKKVLFDGESVRPYMMTRMPQFGEANLSHLPDLLARVDTLEPVDLKIPSPESNKKLEQEREKKLRAGGRELLGDKGLNCIACHNFNGKPSPLNKGMDLITNFQRLQPAWFYHFLRNPGAFRPRIVMPYSWPDGVAAHKTILDGDTDLQIEAIWYYLSLGTSAADPPGIRRQDTTLSVSDVPRVYRGRSSVAGFRGIAVGFPEKLNYAFNAETGTLSAIWTGEFIRVDRGGQGSGGFNPSGRPIALAQDVSFAELADDNAPWPLRPVMTKEAPVNPNPLYPKNLGYQFQEYFLDESLIPTFVYRNGSLLITDRAVPNMTEKTPQLKRTLHFQTPKKQSLWFRALTGEIERESKNVYTTRNMRLTISHADPRIRNLSNDPNGAELLLPIELEQGQSTIELNYEPLGK